MIFFKPKFWDKNKISFFSIFLFPTPWLIKLLSFFKRAITKTHQCSIPIICVGNIYLGGTGKTPLCVEIFSILKNLNMNPAFIRKQYDAFQDEVKLQKRTGPVYQSKKRIDALKEAIQNKTNVAILDDGFQDFSINKNLSIICFNEKQWIGNGLVIPSGPLREKLTALKRCNYVFINGNQNWESKKTLKRYNPNIKIFYTQYKLINLDDIKNKKVLAFAGIANPTNFFDLLKNNNIEIIKTLNFPDHYNFKKTDIINLNNKAKELNACLVTTEKDYFRLNNEDRKNINCLKIELFINNKEEFINELKKIT